MIGSGRVVLPDVREWSGGPPGCLGWLGGPPGCPGVVRTSSRMSGSGRRPFQMSERPSRMLGSSRETLPNVLE